MPIRPINRARLDAQSTATSVIAAPQRTRIRPVQRETMADADVSSLLPGPTKRAHHINVRGGPNWTEDGDYLVGKNRPPVASRWKKGQSGNPSGPKPKAKPDPEADFEREVLEGFTAKINGEDVPLNLGLLGLKQMKSLAAKGNRQAAEYLITMYIRTLRRVAEREKAPDLEAEELAQIDALLSAAGFSGKPVVRKSDEPVVDQDEHDEGDAL